MKLLQSGPIPLLLSARATGRIFSFGCGTQSMACLVLQSQKRLRNPYDAFVFANVGNDSENPDTLKYFHDVALPFAARHGIPLIEVQRTNRDGEPMTLYQEVMKESKTIIVPAYTRRNGGPDKS